MDYDPQNFAHRTALATDIRATVLGLGFTRKDLGPGTREEVYARSSTRIRGVEMRIYTSIVDGEVRDVGGDSIKVCAVYGMTDGSTRATGGDRRAGQGPDSPGRRGHQRGPHLPVWRSHRQVQGGEGLLHGPLLEAVRPVSRSEPVVYWEHKEAE